LTVSGCQNPTVSQIITGQFFVNGANHGKPVYKKDSSDAVSVLIYYWDERNGPSFSGWWFGPKVGGDQVWAHNAAATPTPPLAGWKVPWDGPVDITLKLTTQSGGAKPGQPGQSQPHTSNLRQLSHEEERRRLEVERQRRAAEAECQRQEREAEQQRRLAEQKRRDEQRRLHEEEAKKKQREREEELARREAEAQKRREEEEQRRKEQAAALAVRKVIQRVRIATPETYDSLRNELEDAQAEHLEAMGSQAEKVSSEAEKALHQAQQRIDEINRKREEDERRAAEEEQRKKEEAELVERLMKEARASVEGAGAKVAEAKESSDAIATKAADSSPEAMVDASKATEAIVDSAYEATEAASKEISKKREEMGDNEASRGVRADFGDLQEKLALGRRTLSKISTSVQIIKDKASRKASALRKDAVRKAEFEKHDGDGDGKLNAEEVTAFSKSEYDFEIPPETLEKIMRILEPIGLDKFQRMRSMVAIAKSEVKARATRAEEEEHKRAIQERQRAAHAIVEDATKLMTAAEASVTKCEAEARPSSHSAELPADDMKAIAAKIEDIVRQAEGELAEAAAKIKEVESDCKTEEALQGIMRREVPRLKQRFDRLEVRIEQASQSAKGMTEKALRKKYGELEKFRTEAVIAIHTRMSGESKTGEQIYDDIRGESETVTKDAFVGFVEGLSEKLKTETDQSGKLFEHMAGEAATIDKDQFLQLIRFFYTCVKGTVLTESISIKSKSQRRLEVGDVLECLEGPSTEAGANIKRVRCKAVDDDATGWVTIAGNQGTPFLEPNGNFFVVVRETMLTDGLSVQDSKTIRRIAKGEMIEVLEFAKKDASVGVRRIKGRARLDGATGWVTISGNQGTSYLERC